MTPEQQNEFVETCRAAVNAVLTAITQDDPRFWLEGKYLRWGAVEKALVTGIEQAAGALVTHDPYMPTPGEWAMYPWARLAATDDDGALWLYDLRPRPGVLHDWETHDNAIECEYLRNVARPLDFRNTLRHRPKGI